MLMLPDKGGWISGIMPAGPPSRSGWLRGRITRLMCQAVPGPLQERVTLPGVPGAVAYARQFTRQALGGCDRADDLLIAVSEFATNAVLHSASGELGMFTVGASGAGRWYRVEVTDGGPRAVPSQPGSGYGLPLVAATCDRAGHHVDVHGRRCAWAEVTC